MSHEADARFAPEHYARIAFLFGRTSPGPGPQGAGAKLPVHEVKLIAPSYPNRSPRGQTRKDFYSSRVGGNWIYL